MTTAGEIGEGLSEKQAEALLIGFNATYRPHTVAAQTRFHGKRNETGVEALNLLDGLVRAGLLRYVETINNTDVGTTAHEFKLTTLGKQVAQELQKRGGGE